MKELLAHLVGDYVLQSDWEANEKTKRALPAAIHAGKYTACFLPITRDPRALAVIGGTHYVLDRYRLAKRIAWAKNQVAPVEYRYPYSENVNGYKSTTPDYISFWLMIVADNTVHMLINNWSLRKWAK